MRLASVRIKPNADALASYLDGERFVVELGIGIDATSSDGGRSGNTDVDEFGRWAGGFGSIRLSRHWYY